MVNKNHDALAHPERSGTLSRLRLVDMPRVDALDRLTRLAARLLHCPIALVSIVDVDRQFFISDYGLSEPLASQRETPLSHSICQYVVISGAPLAIDDARCHPLVSHNRAVTDLGIIAYLGVPLTMADGLTLGSFCVADLRPRSWTADDIETITDLAASVMSEINLRHARSELRAASNRRIDVAGRKIEIPLIVVSSAANATRTARAIQAGTLAVRDGSANADDLVDTIEKALASDAEKNSETRHSRKVDQRHAALTERQGVVLDLLLRGLQTKEVARELRLSPRTIEAHRAQILRRLHLKNITQLLREFLADPSEH